MNLSNRKGFTLVELLVVIAVLGILASVILVAVNPMEQMARGRDAGRKTSVGQLANAVQAFYTSHEANYPAVGTWSVEIVDSGEIKQMPANLPENMAGSGECTTNAQNGYCYDTSATEAVVFARLESNSELSFCAGQDAYFLWSSAVGRGGRVCAADESGLVGGWNGSFAE